MAILTSLLVFRPIRITCMLHLLFSAFPQKIPKPTIKLFKHIQRYETSISDMKRKNTCLLFHKTLVVPTVTSPHPQGGTRNPEPEAVVLNVFVWQLQIWRYVAHRHAWLHSLSPRKGLQQKGPGGGKPGGERTTGGCWGK